jgi:hypothetical protein
VRFARLRWDTICRFRCYLCYVLDRYLERKKRFVGVFDATLLSAYVTTMIECERIFDVIPAADSL